MKNDDFKDVQDWISLKKYESPTDEYFDDFLLEVQRRRVESNQRFDFLKTIQSKTVSLVAEWAKPRVAYATFATAACLITVLAILPKSKQQVVTNQVVEVEAKPSVVNISAEHIADAMPHMQRLDFGVSVAPLKVEHQQLF